MMIYVVEFAEKEGGVYSLCMLNDTVPQTSTDKEEMENQVRAMNDPGNKHYPFHYRLEPYIRLGADEVTPRAGFDADGQPNSPNTDDDQPSHFTEKDVAADQHGKPVLEDPIQVVQNKMDEALGGPNGQDGAQKVQEGQNPQEQGGQPSESAGSPMDPTSPTQKEITQQEGDQGGVESGR